MVLMADSISLSSKIFLARRWAQMTTNSYKGPLHFSGIRKGRNSWLCRMYDPISPGSRPSLDPEMNYVEFPGDLIDFENTQPPAKAYRQKVLSGIQPTGSLHLGNYLGAVNNWIGLQDLYETLFCVVDMHAITVPHEPSALLKSTRSTAALYIASGIDPDKSTIFVQSHVSAHAELFWLLNCITPIGWLQRMIQFKEKSKKMGEDVRSGLLTYPVLMAADVLAYQADLVPVGEDQVQHLELTRDIAARVNYLYGGKKWKKMGGRSKRLLKVPNIFVRSLGARVMSLQDGTSKMSKSAESDLSRINLLDSPDEIRRKIKKAKTDAFSGLELDNPDRPECTNLLNIYRLVSGLCEEDIEAQVSKMTWGEFKPILADAIIAKLEPVQTRYKEVMEDPEHLEDVLRNGASKASALASRTLEDCYQAMGFDRSFLQQ